MSSSSKSPIAEQYNHPFGHLFGKRVNLSADHDKVVFRAEETDKVLLREFLQWNKLLNEMYSTFTRKDLRQRYATEEQWQEEKKWYEEVVFKQFAVLKHFYQDRYEKYHELSQTYGVGQSMIAVMEKLLKDEVESILLDQKET